MLRVGREGTGGIVEGACHCQSQVLEVSPWPCDFALMSRCLWGVVTEHSCPGSPPPDFVHHSKEFGNPGPMRQSQ